MSHNLSIKSFRLLLELSNRPLQIETVPLMCLIEREWNENRGERSRVGGKRRKVYNILSVDIHKIYRNDSTPLLEIESSIVIRYYEASRRR